MATFICKLWADLKSFPNKSPIFKPIKSDNNLTLFLDTSKMIHIPPWDFYHIYGDVAVDMFSLLSPKLKSSDDISYQTRYDVSSWSNRNTNRTNVSTV